jgi:hypothetical protein
MNFQCDSNLARLARFLQFLACVGNGADKRSHAVREPGWLWTRSIWMLAGGPVRTAPFAML